MTALPWYLLQRHPLTVQAHFAYSLVLTYAFDARALAPMLPRCLEVDTHDGHGFVAVAMVQTRGLRPVVLLRMFGQSFFLAGYRIFTRFRLPGGRTLRGLYILRSDTDRRLMAGAGNLLTHYRYRFAAVAATRHDNALRVQILTPDHSADVDVRADLTLRGGLPAGSPFRTFHEARRFAGPLPYTFDHERETDSIIAIKGEREHWEPRLVNVKVDQLSFLEHGDFARLTPRLASAFYVEQIDYQWNRGVRHRLTGGRA